MLKATGFKIPDTTTAMTPETWSSSAKKKLTEGDSVLITVHFAISLSESLHSVSQFTKAVKIPTANPPIAEIPKEIPHLSKGETSGRLPRPLESN